jgi:hypothetical protein
MPKMLVIRIRIRTRNKLGTKLAEKESLTKKRLTGNLLDLAVLDHVTAINGLELQVAGDLSVKQDLHQLSARHDELGNQVNVPVWPKESEGKR